MQSCSCSKQLQVSCLPLQLQAACMQSAGQQRASKGPTQAEFEISTQLLVFNGKPVPRPRPQPPQQAQQRQRQQQASGLGNSKTTSLHEQGQWWQSRQAELASNRGVKRAIDGVLEGNSHAAKRGKYADQVWPVTLFMCCCLHCQVTCHPVHVLLSAPVYPVQGYSMNLIIHHSILNVGQACLLVAPWQANAGFDTAAFNTPEVQGL